MESPRRNLPKAARRYFYRLVFFYVFSVLAIGVTCPSNDERLTSGGAGAGSSPFVVAIANAGISVLPSIINAVILISAWSSGNSFLYMSSRSLYSLAISGNAPHIFKKCTKSGVPIYAVGVSSLFTLLSYLNISSSGGTVFTWFVNLTNVSFIFAAVLFGIVCQVQLPLTNISTTDMGHDVMDMLHDHLHPFPQSLRLPQCPITMAQLRPTLRRMDCTGVIHGPLPHQWLHLFLPRELVCVELPDCLRRDSDLFRDVCGS